MADFCSGFVFERGVYADLTIEGNEIPGFEQADHGFRAQLPSGEFITAPSLNELVQRYVEQTGLYQHREAGKAEHVQRLRSGKDAWNGWRREHPEIQPILTGVVANESFPGLRLDGYDFSYANLTQANLQGASLQRANFHQAILARADLSGAHLDGANFCRTDLYETIFRKARLTGANLQGVQLTATDLRGADLSGCTVYGISAWGLKVDGAKSTNLRVTPIDEATVTVDSLEVAQFVYLLLHNEKIRDVIDTVGRKGVLLLGRFTDDRVAVLERLRDELRKRGFLPIIFNFDKPETKDFTETVRLLAGLSHFVIADITCPKSAPAELQATVPDCMVPFIPIIQKGEEPFAMLRDLWLKYPAWVLETIRYSTLDRLIEVLDLEVIKPAEERFAVLLARKGQQMPIREF